jgi:hypothetical protein
MKIGTIASPWHDDVGAYGHAAMVTLVGAIDLSARSTAAITNFGLQTLLRDAVLPLVPVGDNILDERRGRYP